MLGLSRSNHRTGTARPHARGLTVPAPLPISRVPLQFSGNDVPSRSASIVLEIVVSRDADKLLSSDEEDMRLFASLERARPVDSGPDYTA
jgi:hypothetical protein